MSDCKHSNVRKHGVTRRGEPRYRCGDCGKFWQDHWPRHFAACDICGAPAVHLFRCQAHWDEVPDRLKEQWFSLPAAGGTIRQRLGVAARIMQWRRGR